MDINATWKKLTTVINSLAVSSHQGVLKSNYTVLHTIIANYILHVYVHVHYYNTRKYYASMFK